MARHAHTLIELLFILAMIIFLMALSAPLFSTPLRKARFLGFTSELTGTLIMARKYAQASGLPVHLDLTEEKPYRFRTHVVEGPETRVLWENQWIGDPHKRIRLQLPDKALLHPTNDSPLIRPLSSTHAPKVIFAGRGASAATMVFSDGRHHAVCVVVNPRNGSFKVFIWHREQVEWFRFY